MRFKKHVAGKRGWSEWIFPKPKYLFKCCDCGLIHEIEFATFVGDKKKRVAIRLPDAIRTMFRVRRFKVHPLLKVLSTKPITQKKINNVIDV